jgi:HPr kinase/phosphorylase
MLSVGQLFDTYGEKLGLTLASNSKGLRKKVRLPEVERPGLALSGYLKGHKQKRILILGREEISFLRDLSASLRYERLSAILSYKIPAVIIARGYAPPPELVEICDKEKVPLFRSKMATMDLLNQLTVYLTEAFSPSITCHGTLVEAFGVGVLIQGDSSVGKSEAALGLIERGHRLVSDDVVRVKRKEGTYLEGSGPELTRHLIEIRGIGIINVANLYGAVCVSEMKRLDVIVKLEEWDDNHFYDRVGLEEKYCDILAIKVPYHLLPVKPGRDVVLLIETIVLNHRLKEMGYHSAKEFNVKLLETIAERQKRPNKWKSYT